ncbi:uncharacterized protein LOC122374250 [Amphibalanus amphitrite]|uniref:uncharacterized protein LOC122374250 n=1 Tax=Amphibalanus amphitrite TaxID=1232801 RepID=UPI001C929502|nr:uncharacterized protein LOC122374250 [Amphibalanus amphitrite]XP_043208812.1 uncharacterized protein LOC122374250 [Amphibalanus amphitrite]
MLKQNMESGPPEIPLLILPDEPVEHDSSVAAEDVVGTASKLSSESESSSHLVPSMASPESGSVVEACTKASLTSSNNSASTSEEQSAATCAISTVQDVREAGPSSSNAPVDITVDVMASGDLAGSGDEAGPPLLQTEALLPYTASDAPADPEQNREVLPPRKKLGACNKSTKPTLAPPVLQPEVITIDDEEPACDFEEPPVLLAEVAVTRKRKGIVRKRSFFGNTVDSSMLKESLLECSPAKKAHKGGTVHPDFPSRGKDDDVTLLLSGCGKTGGDGASPKPRTPSKSGVVSVKVDSKKIENHPAGPRPHNRQVSEKNLFVALSPGNKESCKGDQKTTILVRKDRPLARRMGSGSQPSRRSGAARCRPASVQNQRRFVGAGDNERIKSTGWRSVPTVPLDDVASQCGYVSISEHKREVFAPLPLPPGDLVTLPRNPELAERMQKIVEADGSDPEGVFTSSALEGFLEEKAPLKLSFPVPDCLMPKEKLTDRDAEYPPPAQPPPAIVRPRGEPRFKTLLEKQVWLGMRDEKDLRALRPAQSPSKDDSTDALPLYSLLLPPRYLSPARSSRDLSVHRGRHLLPLSKVMHKSLDMRRAWDKPAEGADCVQFIYDGHRQVRIRGSGSLNDGPTTRGYGKLLRPESVEEKVNAWRENDFQVLTESVSRERALLAAATVQDMPPTPSREQPSPATSSHVTPSLRLSPAAVRHSSRTPRPRRRLLLETEGADETADSYSGDMATSLPEDKVTAEVEIDSFEPKIHRVDNTPRSVPNEQSHIDEKSVCSDIRKLAEATVDKGVHDSSVSDEQKDCVRLEVAGHQGEGIVTGAEECRADEKAGIAGDAAETYDDGRADASVNCKENSYDSNGDCASEEEVQNHSSSGVPFVEQNDDACVIQDTVGNGNENDMADKNSDGKNGLEKDEIDATIDSPSSTIEQTEAIDYRDDNLDRTKDALVVIHETTPSDNKGNVFVQKNEACTAEGNSEEDHRGNTDDKSGNDQQKDKLKSEDVDSFANPPHSADEEVEVAGCFDVNLGATGSCLEALEDSHVSESDEHTLAQQNDVTCADGEKYDRDQDYDAEDNISNDQQKVETKSQKTDSTVNLPNSAPEKTKVFDTTKDTFGTTEFICDSNRALHEPVLKRSDSKEAEVQACLGPDTLEDFSAVANVSGNVEVVENDEHDDTVDLQALQRENSTDAGVLLHSAAESASVDAAHEASESASPVDRLSFFKSLLEKYSRPQNVQTAVSTDQSSPTQNVSMGSGTCSGTECASDRFLKKGLDMAKALVASLLKTTSAVTTTTLDKNEERNRDLSGEKEIKMEPTCSEETNSPQSQKLSGGSASFCKTEVIASGEQASIAGGLQADSANCKNDESFDEKDDLRPLSRAGGPSSAVITHETKAEKLPVSDCDTEIATALRACVHLPRFHPTAVRPFCIFHEVHNCPEYRIGGSCFMTAQRSRILQLQRNLAIRTGRLPALPARHQHTARTFGRVRPKGVRVKHTAESCVALLPIPDGAPLPVTRLPPVRPPLRRFRLPENVRVSDVREVVVLTPVRPGDGSSCYSVRLASGDLCRVGPGDVHAGEAWRMQPADDVIVVAADGRRFRNPQDRDCTDSVDVEKPAGNVTQLSLADVNRSISQGQMLMSGSDGGLVLSPSRVRVMCRDRLRRVAVGCKGRREVFETGTVVVREDAGQLAVIGALPPEVTLHPDKESGSEVSGAPQSVQHGSGESGSNTAPGSTKLTVDDSNAELQVIGTVQGRSKKQQQQHATCQKRTASGDTNVVKKKRRRGSSERRSMTAKDDDKVKQRKALLASTQPRSSNGKFLSATKPVTKTLVVSRPTTGNVSKATADSDNVVVVSAKKARMLCEMPAPVTEAEVPSVPTPSWLMSRLHSVTVEVVPTADKTELTKKLPKTVVKTVSPLMRKKPSTPATGQPSKPMSATGVLMSVIQKISKNDTNPAESSSSVVGESANLSSATSAQEFSQDSSAAEVLKDARQSKPKMKSFTPAKPLSGRQAPKAGVDVNPNRSLLKRSFIAETTESVSPVASVRGPRARPGQSSRRRRPTGPLSPNGTAARICDPARPKVRRKSWADLPSSRQSWTNEDNAVEKAAGIILPRRRSWDNPAARQSWTTPGASRRRARRKSDIPRTSRPQGLVASPSAPPPQTSAAADAQTARTDASEPAAPRLSPPVGRPPPTLLRCDGVPVRRPSGGGGGGDGPDLAPALVDLTTPEKAPSPRPAEAEAAPARRRLKLPLEVTLLNESDMSDDELDDLGELAVSAAPEKKSDDVYCPNIELIEL